MPKGVYKRTKSHILKVTSNLPKSPKYWVGKKFSEEHRKKLSENHKGMSGKNHTEESKKRMSDIMKTNCRPKFGREHHNWKGGITDEVIKVRNMSRYRLWREAVFKRDNWTCQKCGARNGNGKRIVLNAHHIKEFSEYKKLRFNISNGVTLCVDCHRKTFKYHE